MHAITVEQQHFIVKPHGVQTERGEMNKDGHSPRSPHELPREDVELILCQYSMRIDLVRSTCIEHQKGMFRDREPIAEPRRVATLMVTGSKRKCLPNHRTVVMVSRDVVDRKANLRKHFRG